MADRFRWTVVFLLFAVTIINYIDRSSIAFAAHLIQSEFDLSSTRLGLVMGAFGIGYIISTLFGGIGVDRFGSKFVLASTLALWSFAIGWTGAATGFVMLYVARTVLGLAEGPSFPIMEATITKWLPPEERATALSGALVAVPVALAIGSPLVSILIDAFGWRAMFFTLCVLGLLWLPFWLIFFANTPSRSNRISEQEQAFIEAKQKQAGEHFERHVPSSDEWRQLLTNPTLLANYWAYFVFGYFIFFFMSWMPEFLRKSYNLELSQVGYFAFLPWALAAVLLLLFGPWSDRILRRTNSLRKARSFQIAGTQLFAAIAIFPASMIDNLYVAMASITLAVGSSLAANAAYYAVITDLTPRNAGTAMGIMTIWFAAAGFLAPVITGYALDLTGSFQPAFWLLSLLAASSVIGVFFFHHPDRHKQR
ncbi:MFS transporter [Roseibium sp. SCPC15]|uniref:MFS transporter n=1 Tax=Roseibium sp. SCP15 TaxID=3141376 RepID=UPI00333DC495